MRRGKKKPTLTSKDFLKDIKPLKDQLEKSCNELKKILDKYKDTFKNTQKLLGRKTSMALSNANISLKKYKTKYQEIIEAIEITVNSKQIIE